MKKLDRDVTQLKPPAVPFEKAEQYTPTAKPLEVFVGWFLLAMMMGIGFMIGVLLISISKAAPRAGGWAVVLVLGAFGFRYVLWPTLLSVVSVFFDVNNDGVVDIDDLHFVHHQITGPKPEVAQIAAPAAPTVPDIHLHRPEGNGWDTLPLSRVKGLQMPKMIEYAAAVTDADDPETLAGRRWKNHFGQDLDNRWIYDELLDEMKRQKWIKWRGNSRNLGRVLTARGFNGLEDFLLEQRGEVTPLLREDSENQPPEHATHANTR